MANIGYTDNGSQAGYIPQGVTIKTTLNADGSYTQHVKPEINDNLGLDSFGRQRVSNTSNRADVEFIYDKQPLLFDDISSGTGSATHQVNPRDVVCAVGGTATNAIGGLRQHYWTPYTPGSSQQIDLTGTLDNAALGGGRCYLFLRSTISGSTVLVEEMPQGSWTENDADDVDWSKSQIFGIDFQSLKVGRIRWYLVRDGAPVHLHELTNDNIRTTGYWQYASLPPYWKIYNDGTNTVAEIGYGDEYNGVGFRYVFNGPQATATLRAICATVKSEGGAALFDLPGFPFASPRNAAKTVSTSLIPILSIRVKATFNSLRNNTLIIPERFSIQTDNPIDYVILYRPALTNASWVSVDDTYSGVEYDISATAFSGGIVVDNDQLSSGNNQATGESGTLGRTVMALGSGTADILTIAAIRTGSQNAAVRSVFKWKEIR